MGQILKYKCNKCDFEEEYYIGGGFKSDDYWKETQIGREQLKNKVLNGEFGEQLKNIILADLQNFEFAYNEELMQCLRCKQFVKVRKPEIIHWNLHYSYNLKVTFPVKCPICSSDNLYKPGVKALCCPKCNTGEPILDCIGNWD